MKKLLWFIALALLIMAGCDRNTSLEDVSSSFKPTTSFSAIDEYGHILSRAELVEFALNAPHCYSQIPETRAGVRQKEIKNILPFMSMPWMKGKTFSNETARELFNNIYVVNYANDEGFAIISADNRIPQTLAYSDYGVLSLDSDYYDPDPDPTGGDGGNTGGQSQQPTVNEDSIFYEYMKSMAEYVEYLGMYICPQPTLFDSIDEKGYYYCNPHLYYSPYIDDGRVSLAWKSQWDQGSPYNIESKTGFLNDTMPNYRWPVGCVPLALGEIFRYHEYPDTVYSEKYNCTFFMDWAHYPSSFSYLTYDAQALAVFLRKIGDELKVEYNKNGQTSTKKENIIPAITYFGYICDPISKYDISKVVQSLGNGCPVLILGQTENRKGHGWVISGYHSSHRVLLYEYDVYKGDQYVGKWTMWGDNGSANQSIFTVSCDWGWGNKYNGSYVAGTFKDSKGNPFIDGSLKIITNIHPNL